MNQQDLQSQLMANTTTNCITPGCWPYTYTATVTSPTTLTVEKLPGGFIVTLNGRREIVATVDALEDYLKRWSAEK